MVELVYFIVSRIFRYSLDSVLSLPVLVVLLCLWCILLLLVSYCCTSILILILIIILIPTKSTGTIRRFFLFPSSFPTLGGIGIATSKSQLQFTRRVGSRMASHIGRHIFSKDRLGMRFGLGSRLDLDFLIPGPHHQFIFPQQQISLKAIALM
jgi:hypothetical protein